MDLRTLLVDYLRGNILETIKRVSLIDIRKIIKVIDNEVKNNILCGGSIEYVDKYQRIKLLLIKEMERRGVK
jgi:hypothetical protein